MSAADWVKRNTEGVPDDAPRAWALVANGNWAHAEHDAIVALFDTKDQGQAYFDASKLPEDENRTEDGKGRSFRRDSLLWEFNNSSRADYGSVLLTELAPTMPPWIVDRIGSLPINPDPPAGDESETPAPGCQHHIGVTISDKSW